MRAPDDPPRGPLPDAPLPEEEDEDRAAILRRRAVFIASAIAGLGITTASCGEPQPCLNVVQVPTATVTLGDPQPCLTMAPVNSGTPSDADAGVIDAPEPTGDLDAGLNDAGDAGDAGKNSDAGNPRPRPCLKVAPPPQPCLKVAPQPCLDITVPDDP